MAYGVRSLKMSDRHEMIEVLVDKLDRNGGFVGSQSKLWTRFYIRNRAPISKMLGKYLGAE